MRLLMIQTRLVTRPLYSEYVKSVQDPRWNECPNTDYLVYLYGPIEVSPTETSLVWNAGKKYMVGECRTVEQCRMPHILHECIAYATKQGYSHVGFVDDDAIYTDPPAAMHAVAAAFRGEDQPIGDCKAPWAPVGCVGPIDAYRAFRRYENKPRPVEPLYRNPWAPLGSQIYALDVLPRLGIEPTRRLRFRIDAIISMLMWAEGYGNYEINVGFKHVCSSGLDRAQHTGGFHQQMIEAGEHDFGIYRDIINARYPQGRGRAISVMASQTTKIVDTNDHLMRTIDQMARAHEKRHTTKRDECYARAAAG